MANNKDTRTKLMDYATEYNIGEYKLAWRGQSWGIYELHNINLCYDKSTNKFNFEPLPSNRTDKFFVNCRFGLDEAKVIIDKLNKKN